MLQTGTEASRGYQQGVSFLQPPFNHSYVMVEEVEHRNVVQAGKDKSGSSPTN
jgi:hypothetical protein